jgi:cytochrome b subunit of formate dehydrogenase
MKKAVVKRARSDATTVTLHWLLVSAMVLSLATGLQIAADAVDSTWSRLLSPILMQGEVTYLHTVSAFALLGLAVAYASFLWRARLTSRVALELRNIVSSDREMRWRAVNRAMYWLAFGLIAVAAVTGTLLYFAPGLLPSAAVVVVHRSVAWVIIAYVALHVAAQLAMGGFRQLLKIVTPRAAYGGAALFALSVSGIALATMLYPVEKSMIESLRLNRVTQGPVLDGEPDEDVWRQAKPVTIHTTDGANLPGSEVKVRVRGVRDDNHAYLLFEWQDATRSQKHLPLIKTADGWKVLESQYAVNDENGYYEDKFAVMLSRTSKIGGGATQMGPKPLGDKPAPAHGRGMHYTTDGSIVDVWHWKSVRTGPLQQLDDNYFGPPLAEKQGERYTGGYTQDPKTGGGFEQNWKKIEGSDFVHPKRLPRDLNALQERMGAVDLNAGAGDAGQLWMKLAETVPYSKELDTYPVGTVIPSVLIDKPFEGDRGDVAGVATWKDGWWRLETRRKLTTGSKFDVPIDNGTYLWVAVFDHNQTRHSRHLHPVRIDMGS